MKYNQKITIQKGEVSSDFFEDAISFSAFYTCFACIKEKSLAENVRDGNLTQDETLTFEIRWCQKVRNLTSDGYQLIFNERVYDIMAIDHQSFKNRTITIIARRRSKE